MQDAYIYDGLRTLAAMAAVWRPFARMSYWD